MPRSYDDDDRDDDRPRKKRRRDDDDDYDHDQPRRKPKPKSGGGGMSVIMIVLIILGGLGALACVAAILLYPAVMRVRGSSRDTNNLRQVGLGMHFAHDRTGGLSQYARDNTGRVEKGLSFRVELLPYIEQDNLYRRFNMRESWDGPTNRSASNTPIKTYSSPFDGDPTNKTPYRVFYGNGAMFEEDGASVSLMTILDGTSNTIMAVHAVEQVPWAEPRELKYDPRGPLPKLGHPDVSGKFTVLLADGSVRYMSNTVSDRTLRQLITKADGEVIMEDW